MRTLQSLAVLCLLTAPFGAHADEAAITLKPGEGIEETTAQCAACHSLDYIQMNSPFASPETWKTEVTKMRKAFGANIDDDLAGKIAAYLAAQYGAAS